MTWKELKALVNAIPEDSDDDLVVARVANGWDPLDDADEEITATSFRLVQGDNIELHLLQAYDAAPNYS